jgi:hypothetical protein
VELIFFFELANIIDIETLARRKEAEKGKNNDAAYRRNINKPTQTSRKQKR